MESHRICFRCGAEFALGGLAYQVRIQMVADFDGYINADGLLDAGFAAMTVAAERSEEQLTEEVYRERTLLLCLRCAERAWAAVTEPGPREIA